MKLPEAIAFMLDGCVMVDAGGDFFRANVVCKTIVKFQLRFRHESVWVNNGEWLSIDGWREATPEELKEIKA